MFVEILRFLPFKHHILAFFMRMFGVARRQNFDQAVERARVRIDTQDMDKPDFISYILRANESAKALTSKEITANTALLLDAGSETTASLLSGMWCRYATERYGNLPLPSVVCLTIFASYS